MRGPLILLTFLFFFISVEAQNIFKGGAGSGYGSATLSNATLGINIFSGGSGSGYGSASNSSLQLGVNIFSGGAGSGYSQASASAVTLGVNIFSGGAGSGYSSNTLSGAVLGINIFQGGAGSGYGTAYSFQTLANRIRTPQTTVVNATASSVNTFHEISFTANNALKQYVLWRQLDDEEWHPVDAKVKDLGGQWQFTIPATVHNTHRYKVVVVDAMDTRVTSNTVELSTGEELVSVFPNPASEYLDITLNRGESQAVIKLYDMRGVLRAELSAGQQTRLDVRDFPSDVYLLRFTSLKKVFTKKIIIKH
jgi:hypothetical protein